MSNTLISEDELKRLNKISRDEIISLDPSPLLDALCIEYTVHRNGTEYLFKSHSESTPSSRFKLYNSGVWAFVNFANKELKGTIITLIQKYDKGMSFRDAMSFCYDYHPNAKNYAQEALEIEKLTNKYSFDMEKKQKELKELREKNKSLSEKYSSTSKVTKAYEIYKSNEKASEFLNNRGLDKIPPFLMTIKGEYEKFNDETNDIILKYQTGIGVLTGNIKEHLEKIKNKEDLGEDASGDIHYFKAYPKKDGSMAKTQSFGEKTFSYWFSKDKKNEKTVMLFESKMDAAAAYCENPNIWTDYNVVIANGVGTYQEIANFIEKNQFNKIINYNQNDFAAVQFIINIMNNVNSQIKSYEYLKYKKDEYKIDVNDLYKNKIVLSDRFEKNKDFKSFLLEYLNLNDGDILALKRNMTDSVSLNIYAHDEKILRVLDSTPKNKNIDEYLFDGEKVRYKKLLDAGFIRDHEKRKIWESNFGKTLEDLEIASAINTKQNDRSILVKTLINLGVNMKIKDINNPQDLKMNLEQIDLNSDEEYENLQSILTYLEKNKKDKEVHRIIDDWIKETCENNTKDDIEKAKFIYFLEFEEILDKKFKLINIAKNLGNNLNAKKNTPLEVETTEIDLTFNEDSFVPVDETNESNEVEEEILNQQAVEVKNEPVIVIETQKADAQENTQQKIKEDASINPKTSISVTNESIPLKNNNNELDVEYEFVNYTEILKSVKKDLLDVQNINEKQVDGLKSDAIKNAKTINLTIWTRLDSSEIVNAIKNEPNKEKRNSLVQQRKEISEQCKENTSIINTIEKKQEKQTEKTIIDTKSISNSKQLVEELRLLCKQVNSTVNLIKNTANELSLKKNNESEFEESVNSERHP